MDMRDLSRLERPGEPPRIAVIGGGIAGLSSAWLLQQVGRVTLFEGGEYIGGHTHTVEATVSGVTAPVDTGFLVFNAYTYPNLCALFRHLEVPIAESEMSFGVSLEAPDLEWSGTDLNTVFAQRRNLARPAMWRMLADILRFNRTATDMAQRGDAPELSLGEYLARERYGVPFQDWYLLPMAAAIWSCPTRTMLDYPLATFVRFCHNHGLVRILARPQWMTVRGGGREYVKRIVAQLADVRVASPVTRVARDADGVWVHAARGVERFDEVVFACHSDQALAILGEEASVDERSILSAIRYQPNRAVLHTDTSLLPRRRAVWSAWNYLSGQANRDGERPVAVSYLLNRLQPLPFERPVIVSLNPFHEPEEAECIARFEYAHPVFDRGAIEAQARLSSIQGVRRSWFAGAWTGYGFHEDGLKSALEVAQRLGAVAPWQTAESETAEVAA